MADSRALNLSQIEVLVAVVEAGSLLAASRRSGIPRSTLRRQLSELEAQIGQELFNKKSGKLVPTDAGMVVFERGQALLADSVALLRDARATGDGIGRRLQFGLPAGVPAEPFSMIWRMANERFPEVLQVRVVENPLQLLDEGADMVFCLGQPPADGPWHAIEIFTIPVRLYASHAYLMVNPAPTSIEDLAQHTLMRWIEPGRPGLSGHRLHSLPLLGGGRVPAEMRIACNDEALLRRLMLDGGGIALLPAPNMHGIREVDHEMILPDVIGADVPGVLVVPNELGDAQRPRELLRVMRSFLPHLTERFDSEFGT